MENISAIMIGSGLALAASGGVAESIIAVSMGGAYSQSQVEAYHKPWEKMTNNTVVSEDYSGGLAEVKAQVDAGNVTWDVIAVDLADAVRGCDEGLFEEVDPSAFPDGADGTPAEEDFIEGALTDCSAATVVWSNIVAYDKTVLPDGPTKIADFYDLDKYPGKRGLRKTVKANLEMALLADGVGPDDVYDLLETEQGIARAFAKMDTIKDSIIWWEAGAQPPQLLADGEVLMTTAYNGRIFNAMAAEGMPFETLWDGQIYSLGMWAVLKDAPNKDLAMDFLTFATATEQLATQASYISYGPARKSAVPLISTFHGDDSLNMAPFMPTAPENFSNALFLDFEFWADNEDELNERFSIWLFK